MTIRNDISIDWETSPRILTVASPSTELTVQDLHDTCRALEDSSEGLSQTYLIESFGKQALGGSQYVGLTAVLNNVQVTFEDRAGPTWILCNITGGNLVAVDENGDEMSEIKSASYVNIRCARDISAALIGMEDVSEDVADAVHDKVVEGSMTFQEALRIMFAALANKSNGGGTSTIRFRNVADGKDRIVATVDDNGNRLTVTHDGS